LAACGHRTTLRKKIYDSAKKLDFFPPIIYLKIYYRNARVSRRRMAKTNIPENLTMGNSNKAGSKANRKYKDSVFSLLFSDPKIAAEVYEAIFGVELGPDVKVEIKTLKNVLSGGLFNDVAFLLNGQLIVLLEHQSTINDNMPFRMLLYIAEIYNRLTTEENIYGREKFKIPRPIFIVLYNGTEDMPDMLELKLSDMFEDTDEAGDETNLELIVKVYNINKGRNAEIARRSQTLDEYATFVHTVREYDKAMDDLTEAMTEAVVDCIDKNVLKNFLLNHKREVIGMLLEEWDVDKAIAVAEREAEEKGMEKGMEKGRKREKLEIARTMRAEGIDVDTTARLTGLTVDDVLRL